MPDSSNPQPLLDLQSVSRSFPSRGSEGGLIHAVRDVSLQVYPGEAVGLVGESGSGKSTTGRLALRLLSPTAGSVRFKGTDVSGLAGRDLLRFRREAQIIFQDPFSSLNPRMTIRQILREPLKIHGIEPGREDAEVARLLNVVGLQPQHADRYPFQFSGGQRQRIGIARALALRPELIVADEPVSSLDVSVQAQVINLLQDLQRDMGLALLFVSHNLAVVQHLCTRTAVMQRGEIVEQGPTSQIFERPEHPYTRTLLNAILHV